MRILFFILVLLGLVLAWQLLQVRQIIYSLKNKKEEELSQATNQRQGLYFMLFGIGYLSLVIFCTLRYGWAFAREAASEHGVITDQLLAFNWVILGIVFFGVQAVLFFFAKKYAAKDGKKGYYYSHNNTLEIIWTAIPAATMSIIIIWGLWIWNDIMTTPVGSEATRIELYAKQFDWTARYPGKSGKFGLTNYNLISSSNPLGIVTKNSVAAKIAEIEEDLADLKKMLIEKSELMSDRAQKAQQEKIKHLVMHKNRILQINLQDPRIKDGEDDILVKGEFHLPVNQQAAFQFRSRDVIHSALMFDFRAQMNAVPGLATQFQFTPIITTAQMRDKKMQEDFNYKLTCNKICGASHWNMTMDIIVEEKADFEKWLATQKTFEK